MSTLINRYFAAVAVTALIVAAGPAMSQTTDANSANSSSNAVTRQARFQQHMQTRLNHMAERLKITPAQQPAWTTYTNTVENLTTTKLTKPAPEADATSVARFRAELAAERAQKLSQLADATATLQQALDPEQQKTLSEMVRYEGRRMRHQEFRGS